MKANSVGTQTVSIELPRSVFLKLKRAAELTHRSVGEVLVATVNVALVEPPGLPADLANELAAMQLLSDEALWAAAHPSLSPAEQFRLSQLNHKAGERPLTKAEEAEQEHLLAAYHRSVLRRAKALAVLTQRGHPLPAETEYFDSPSTVSGATLRTRLRTRLSTSSRKTINDPL